MDPSFIPESSPYAFTIAIATVVLLFYIAYTIIFKKAEESPAPRSESIEDKDRSEKKPSVKIEKKQNIKPIKVKDIPFTHKWLAASLKAHSDKITGIDFSSNGKYLISCGLAGLGVKNTVRAFKIAKKEDGSNLQILTTNLPDFPQIHKADIINIGISCNAKYIMTCSRDTIINIWDLKGERLGTVDTKMMNNSFASISPCGRFFGACGFTPEVRTWEVCFDKSGSFSKIKPAFQLSHAAGVYNFSFNADATRMASVSKDKTWKLWNTKIDFERGQEAELLLTGNIKEEGSSLIALSPDSYTIAIASNKTLSFFSAITAKCEEFIENVCNENISEIAFSSCSNYLALACDKHVKIFNNIAGHRVAIESLKKELVAAKTEGAKQRIEQSIDTHYDFIQKVECAGTIN